MSKKNRLEDQLLNGHELMEVEYTDIQKHEHSFRHGYRSGFIRCLDTIFDYQKEDFEKVYNQMFNFWQRNLVDWSHEKDDRIIPAPPFIFKP